jgi:hypothetical protein
VPSWPDLRRLPSPQGRPSQLRLWNFRDGRRLKNSSEPAGRQTHRLGREPGGGARKNPWSPVRATFCWRLEPAVSPLTGFRIVDGATAGFCQRQAVVARRGSSIRIGRFPRPHAPGGRSPGQRPGLPQPSPTGWVRKDHVNPSSAPTGCAIRVQGARPENTDPQYHAPGAALQAAHRRESNLSTQGVALG